MLRSNQTLLKFPCSKNYLHKSWTKILATNFKVKFFGIFVSLCLLLHSTPLNSHTEGGVLLIIIFYFVVILALILSGVGVWRLIGKHH